MPKNKGKGGKNRRRGKNENDFMKRELDKKEDGQEYGQVIRMVGNGRVEVFCFDGKKRVCHIRGKLRKKVWINLGDIILLGLRDYQDDKADVILKYTADEARRLKTEGELPENAKINDNDDQDEGEIVFAEDIGGLGGDDDGADTDDDMPSSGSDSDDESGDDAQPKKEKPKKVMNKPVEESEESSEEEGSDEEEESSDDSANFLNEEDLAQGKGLGRDGGRRGAGGRGGKNKYGKRR